MPANADSSKGTSQGGLSKDRSPRLREEVGDTLRGGLDLGEEALRPLGDGADLVREVRELLLDRPDVELQFAHLDEHLRQVVDLRGGERQPELSTDADDERSDRRGIGQ